MNEREQRDLDEYLASLAKDAESDLGEQTHPCDECGTPTPESELQQVDPDEDDEDEGWLCKTCYGEVTAGEEWKDPTNNDDEDDGA